MSCPRRLPCLLLLSAFLLLSGCAGGLSRNDTGEAALLERATAYWAAREAGDAVKAYEYESASVTGEQTLQAYVKRMSLVLRKAAVLGGEITGENGGRVRVAVEYVLPGVAGIQKAEFDDEWVAIEGRWYHRWRPPRKPGGPR